ncbi:AMP-dependent synthetase/ligase [Marinilabilia rubra]|uniref:Long-chain fatty acid--CoA ligase n=1 Tax=Marinilabilia rubra TaxID=2162893 RepID=A0A2U2B747_9BACT|nr:long-chain fatty acid--CoA ligase [Marinilabilia rubra]PWD98901.1 long-chain fatty acid--CoA ligase [Marinilabilia rubra]
MEDHVIKMLLNRIENYGSGEIIRFREKTRKSWTWNHLGEKVEQVLTGLNLLGCREMDSVGIISQNRAEWLVADLGIMANRSVTVPIYATSSPDQIQYIIEEAEIRILFVGTCEQKDSVKFLLDEVESLEYIVVFDECKVVDERVLSFNRFIELSGEHGSHITLNEKVHEYHAEDLATIIYSSGTTGEPKGVMLKHSHFAHTYRVHQQRLKVSEKDVSLAFLPLSHVFERLWTHFMLYSGVVNVFLDNPRDVVEAMREVRPTLMCAVPRFFDKTYQGVQAEMSKWSPVKKSIFKWAVSTGLKANKYRSRSEMMPRLLQFRLSLAEKLVFQKLRNVLGGNIRFMPCAGAALSDEILKFFHAVGLFITYGYGLTETSATVSCFRDDYYQYGTCGSVMPEVEVKIGENHEILVKGEGVFSGYFKKEEATREVMTDGWFHTGDKGCLDSRGNLIMVDRIKDLMKTSVGKYISPQKIETLFASEELVEQMLVVGDNRPYVTALIVPLVSKLKMIAQTKNIEVEDEDELLYSKEVNEAFEEYMHELQEHLAPYERVKKFALLQHPFTIEDGTMTNTLKLRRRHIEKKYQDVIDKLYA